METVEKKSWKDNKLSYVLAFTMIAVGLLGIQSGFGRYSDEIRNIAIIIFNFVLVLFGIAIILMPNKNNMRAIGFYAIALGGGRIIRSFAYITSESDTTFYFGMIMMALGASLMLCGVSYLRGVSKNTPRAMVITSTIVIGYTIYMLFMLHWGYTWDSMSATERNFAPMVVMYAVYLIVLSTREVQSNIPIEKIRSNLGDMAHSVRVEDVLSISESDLERLKSGFTDRSSWTVSEKKCPVESEITMTLSSKDGDRDAVIQKWKGKDGLFLTMINDSKGSFVRGFRAHILSVEPESNTWDDCKAVELIDSNGLCVRFNVIRGVADES